MASSSNVFTTGYFQGTVNFNPSGSDLRTSNGDLDVFITKYNANGTYAWTRAFGGTGYDAGYKAKTDSAGNVYVVGEFSGSVNFNAVGSNIKTSAGGTDLFLVKYNFDGSYGWTQQFGGAYADVGQDLAIDASGNIFVIGGYGYASSDTDILLLKYNSSGTSLWNRQLGDIYFDMGRRVAVDLSGNAYITGTFNGTFDFDYTTGTDPRSSTGMGDMFLTRYNSDGTYGWTVTHGGDAGQDDSGFGVAVDGDGKITLVAAEVSNSAGKEAVVVRYTSSGVYDGGLNIQYSETGDENPFDLSVDASGNRYIVGKYHNGAINGLDAYLTKVNSADQIVWTKTIGGTGSDTAWGVAADSRGIVYVAGDYSNTVDFDLTSGANKRTSNGSTDAFLMRYSKIYSISGTVTVSGSGLTGVTVSAGGLGSATTDGSGSYSLQDVDYGTSYTLTAAKTGYIFSPTSASGTLTGNATANFTAIVPTYNTYTKTFGGSSNDKGWGVAVDSNRNVFLAGAYQGTVNFNPAGSYSRTSNGSTDAFLTKYNADGTFAWTKTFGGTGADEAYDVKTDTSGNIYVAGYFSGSVNFNADGSDIKTSSGYNDAFITKYNAAGVYQWTITYGDDYDDFFTECAIDSSGNIIAVGGHGYGQSDTDILIVKYNSSGVLLWGRIRGDYGFDIARRVITDSNGNIFVTGEFAGTVSFVTGWALITDGSQDAFLAKLDSSGVFQWANSHISDTAYLDESGFGVALESDNRVSWVHQRYEGSSDAVTIMESVNTGDGSFSEGIKFNFSPGGFERPLDMFVDTEGNQYVVGKYASQAGDLNGFIVKLDSADGHLFTYIFGDTGDDGASSVAVDGYGIIYASGWFSGTLQADSWGITDNRTSSGNTDALLIRLSNLISGYITANGSPLSGVTVTGSGTLGSTTTNSLGQYFFNGVPIGTSYTLTPTKTGYTFSPVSASGTLTGIATKNFTATPNTYTLSGTVTVGGSPLSGVTVKGSGSLGTKTTNSSGQYSFTGVPPGTSYTLTPAKTGYTFSPTSASGTLTGNATKSFTATLNTYTLSGTVTAGGSPLSGVTVKGSGSLGSKTTNSSGQYSFTGVPSGTSYTLTPSKTGYTFSPTSASGTLTGNATKSFTATPKDTDGDGVTDPQEVLDGTNPNDSGSYQEVLGSTLCSEWNGFLGITNIMEHVNLSASTISVKSKFYSITGAFLSEKSFSIKSGNQFDLILNDMGGFTANSYGKVCSTITKGKAGDLDGRMVYYKGDSSGGHEFAFAMPFGNGLRGRQYVQYNTYGNTVFSDENVANWIQVTNLENTAQSGKLVFYNDKGGILKTQSVKVNSGARADISAHQLGKNKIGLVEWIPNSSTARFQIRNVRYYSFDSTNNYYGAYQLEGFKGSGETLVVPFDTELRGMGYYNFSNVTSSAVDITLKVYTSGNSIPNEKNITVGAHNTVEFQTGYSIPLGKGIITLDANKPGSMIATYTSVTRDIILNGPPLNIYGLYATQPIGSVMKGSYNTFINQSCSLLLANPTSKKVTTSISMKNYTGAQPLKGAQVAVPANGLVDYNLCSKDSANVYGVVTVQPTTPNSIVPTVVRKGAGDSYRFPTPVRE